MNGDCTGILKHQQSAHIKSNNNTGETTRASTAGKRRSHVQEQRADRHDSSEAQQRHRTASFVQFKQQQRRACVNTRTQHNQITTNTKSTHNKKQNHVPTTKPLMIARLYTQPCFSSQLFARSRMQGCLLMYLPANTMRKIDK